MIRKRGETKQIHAGALAIGGGAPVSVQSMTNAPTADVGACLEQIAALAEAGCDLVRVTVPDREAAAAFGRIRAASPLPLCADIHFDYRLALAAVDNGADKIRINPGNIGSEDRVAAVARACAGRHVPIRVGVNSGSVRKDLLVRYGGATEEALLASAAENIEALERCGFTDICLSIKASDAARTVAANLAAARRFPYPLHIGVTEAGCGEEGKLRSAVGIGALLVMGIGDTVRVSLTGDLVQEVVTARKILMAAGVADRGIDVVSCPTCGRTRVALPAVVEAVKAAVSGMRTDKKLTVAVMGCEVNGPGEAREADVGIAGGKGEFLLFVRGEPVGKVPQESAVPALVKEIEKLL
ncbi:MAG: flavodoxin-dependent (E)-4-hydroxy-3-methylbut-2-enyl-diphosphate synthase [Oscillospiraceae bacterium]|nr:flavodoxin-dependent (E)-4-hydroxy-3-methylbut-2-enyl-diphosphate synthase [Oscillospiraceae bacterium]